MNEFENVKVNKRKHHFITLKTAELDILSAQDNITYNYIYGIGTNCDLHKAFYWMNKIKQQNKNYYKFLYNRAYMELMKKNIVFNNNFYINFLVNLPGFILN